MEGQSLAADAIDGDFVPIGLLTENPNVAVARLQIDGEVGSVPSNGCILGSYAMAWLVCVHCRLARCKLRLPRAIKLYC